MQILGWFQLLRLHWSLESLCKINERINYKDERLRQAQYLLGDFLADQYQAKRKSLG